MALVIKDRVKETTNTTGNHTNDYDLLGAVSGFEAFSANLSGSDTTYYVCTDNTDFEIGLGTYNSSTDKLARTTILASSNSNNSVVWSSGTRTIFMTYPADKAVFKDASGNINGTFVGNITGTLQTAAQTNITSIGTLASNLNLGGQDIVTTTSNQDIDLAAHGTGKVVIKGNDNPGTIVLNCESNSHGQTIKTHAHTSSVTNVLTLPDGGDQDIVGTTATQTLTNKSLTAPTLTGSSSSAGSILFKEDTDNGTNAVTLIGPASTADVTVTLPAATDTLVGKATTDTLTNKTIDVDNNTVSNIEVDNFKASAIVLESEGIGSNDNDTSLPTSAAVKNYVDTQITAEDLDLTTDSGTIAIDLDSETLTVTGGTGIDTSASGNEVTIAGSNASTSSKGIASFSSSDFSVSSGAVSIKSSGVSNTQLAGSIANSKLANDSVSFGGVSVDLGASDATPAFDLSDATNYPTSSLSGTITNAQLAGSIAASKLAGSIGDSKLSTISTAGKVALSALEIDGASDIGEDLVNADLIIVDNGAGGTEVKSELTRVKKYIYSAMSGDATASDAGAVTIANGAVETAMLADDAVDADKLASNAVVNASVASSAAIAFSKMENLTASRALVSDGSGDVSVSAVTSTEVGYLDGVTSAIQTQLDAKTTATAAADEATALAIALG